ncbi:hypothetical protein MRS44_018727 [Fusarium solani]|uniref:uncharacterized protein n=1 Tax=Fusarium solani TaxID=169388 RepID=UPI0032C3EDA6|nr:hypothetical protein MRS44_018727 [Fusarium solani]
MAKRAARQEEQARKEDGEKGEGKGDDCNCNDNDDGIAADKKAAGSKTGKEAAGNKSDDDKEGRKRKADGDPDKGPKTKKKKDEPKAKVPKPRGKPCGLGLAMRMRAKRAVAGRTLPYDMLLDTYRKEKQAKQQGKSVLVGRQVPSDQDRWLIFTSLAGPEAALDVKAPVEDEGQAENGSVGRPSGGNNSWHESAGPLEADAGAFTDIHA